MATLFRAVVMLSVLVGLPAAWVYYGPLPPAAMGVVERTIATARQSLGWESRQSDVAWQAESQGTAPRFDSSLAAATEALQPQSDEVGSILSTRPITRDSQFSLASATVPAEAPVPPASDPLNAKPLDVDAQLAAQLEPHLSLLRKLGAEEYTLENWGGQGQFYRFRCATVWGDSQDHTRQFEAVDADPLRAVHQVVGEVTAWQNARHMGGTSLLR